MVRVKLRMLLFRLKKKLKKVLQVKTHFKSNNLEFENIFERRMKRKETIERKLQAHV